MPYRGPCSSSPRRLTGSISGSKQAGQVGTEWRSFLDFKTLQAELAKPTPDLAALDAVYLRFDSGQDGLNLRVFADVRRALRHYLITARAIGNPQLAKQYPPGSRPVGQVFAGVSGSAEPPRCQPREQCSRLAARRPASGLGHRSRPPQVLEAEHLRRLASPATVAALLARPVDEVGPVSDCILGTSIHGTGHTTGSLTVEMVPSPRPGGGGHVDGRLHGDQLAWTESRSAGLQYRDHPTCQPQTSGRHGIGPLRRTRGHQRRDRQHHQCYPGQLGPGRAACMASRSSAEIGGQPDCRSPRRTAHQHATG